MAQVKLLPAADGAASLLSTLQRANETCQWIAGQAWEQRVFRQFALQKLVYREARERFGLPSQLAIRAIAKVADACKAGGRARRRFHRLGAFPFDARLLTWNLDERVVSLRTIGQRDAIPFAASERALGLLAGERGEADLCLVDGTWCLYIACERAHSTVIVETASPMVVVADPEDDKYLAVALERRAHYVVTGDGHRLDLATHEGYSHRAAGSLSQSPPFMIRATTYVQSSAGHH